MVAELASKVSLPLVCQFVQELIKWGIMTDIVGVNKLVHGSPSAQDVEEVGCLIKKAPNQHQRRKVKLCCM